MPDILTLEKQSQYQKIQLFEEIGTGRITLTLDRFIQLIEGDNEKIYHEALAYPVKDYLKDAQNLLILGGGDGCLLREMFKIKPDVKATLVDIDKDVINLSMSNPKMLRLNKGSLYKTGVKIITENALDWVQRQAPLSYDIAILDFPDPTSDKLRLLYQEPFLTDVKNILKDKGIISMQAGGRNWESTYVAIEKVFNNCNIHRYKMPTLGSGIICWGIKHG